MTARALLIVCVSVALSLVTGRAAEADGCIPCAFAGFCGQGDEATSCPPSEAGCQPAGGVMLFSATTLDGSRPANWQLFARGRQVRASGRFAGKLKVYSDVADPGFPGFPARRRTDEVYWGRATRFEGTLVDDRLDGTARYANGEMCEFHMLMLHGVGVGVPNGFLCRAPSGEVLAEGGLQVILMRLHGCRP